MSRACFPDPGENHGLVRTRIHNTGFTIYILLIVSLLLKIERLVTELQQCGGSGSEWFRNFGLDLDPTLFRVPPDFNDKKVSTIYTKKVTVPVLVIFKNFTTKLVCSVGSVPNFCYIKVPVSLYFFERSKLFLLLFSEDN